MKQLINKAASGDGRAIREVFKLQAMIAEDDKSTDETVVVNIVRWADPTEQNAGARTDLWVALRKDDALLGAITVYRRRCGPSPRSRSLLQNSLPRR
jgi:hypothetical protein